MTAMIAQLCRYPEQIIFRATDPAGHLVATHTFPPSIAEVVKWCEEQMKPAREEELRQRRRDESARVLAAPIKDADPKRRKAFIDRVRQTRPEIFPSERNRALEPVDEEKLYAIGRVPIAVSRALRESNVQHFLVEVRPGSSEPVLDGL